MDKRRSPRYAIQLNALVHPNAGRSWLCTIRDFCDSGMLLVEQEASRRRALPGIAPGENVGIHFSVPTRDKDKHFRLEGKIIRVMDSGVGIAFAEGIDDEAMTALLNYAQKNPVTKPKPSPQKKASADKQAAPAEASPDKAGSLDLADDSGISQVDARKVIAGIRQEVVRVLPEMNSAFFSYMDEQLLVLARDAKNNAEQSEYFAAMSNLEKAKKDVGQSFINEVLDQIDTPRNLRKLLEERKAAEAERKQKQSSRVKLSLVNTDDFEDWLAIANIISRSERVYEKYLDEIQQRLGMLVDSWGHNEANPIGTAVFCHAFENAIRKVELSKDIRQTVYSGFESKSVPLFRKLYIAITRMLEESGVFPDIDDDFVVPAAAIKTEEDEPEAVVEEEPEPEEEEEPEPEPDAVEAEDAVGQGAEQAELRSEIESLRAQLQARNERRRSERPNRGGQSRPQPPAPQPAAQPSTASPPAAEPVQQAPAPRSRRPDIGEAISNIYSTVRSLMGQRLDDYDDEYDALEGDDIEMVRLEEVQEILSSLQSEVQGTTGRVPIRRRLQESVTAGGRRRRISPQALESLGVVENLVDTIEDDSMLSGSAKDWIRQLELTLDKVATQDDDFLDTENPHRSLEVVNQLARLGGTESGSIKRNVDEIVSFINENFDSNPDVFDDAAEKLAPLLDRQSRAFTGNVQRTVKASEGQQTLINAQRAVVDEMNSMISGRQVPEVLLKLLVPGWRNLLVNTHLRQGEESSDWKKHVRALDQVFQYLEGNPDASSPDYIPPDELVDQIEQGLESIAFEPGQRAPLINSLRRFIVDGADSSAIPMVDVPDVSVARTIGFGEVDQRDTRRSQLRQENEDNSVWQRSLQRAEDLHVGEWLEISGGSKSEDEIAIVAWTNEEHSNFVFVNRRGVKTHELMVEEIATRLVNGTVRILEEADIPLTDRASHRMLQNMHNQLTHQATHDELTGLVNRKEFERQLVRVLGITKRNESHHVVAYMDLDQFKVVNNSAGHEAGDKLLREIAALLEGRLRERQVVLSRLGGDEYGVLIEDCEPEPGLAAIKELCEAVKQHKFEWDGREYSLTVSCGVVNIDKENESVSSILAGVDDACFAAKDAGRDRIHVYTANDSVIEHRRDIMEWVSRIDRAIEQDRFVLNCQKIEPIDKNSREHSHYEILLTVLDDAGNPMPPQDFIIAAETYNRMSAIDRWVIRNSFKFIANNILKLDDLGAFSINISGNSLTEENFMEFVLEQFKETRLPTSKICFEITETSAIGSIDSVIEFMEKLKIIGVQFSLDDFGTGLSSYSYLRSLPVDYLKIDGIFVKDIKNNPNDYAVVKSINEIGHFMGKKTIAEFVEDDEILEILREIGVDFAQGWGIGMKRPIVELLEG